MNLILLPGNGKYNKEWIDEVRDNFENLFTSTHVLYYDHWFVDEERDIDLEAETKKLAEIVKGLDDYVVFAKSMGSTLTIKAIHEGVIAPSKCIFTGHPVNWARERNYYVDEWIKGYATPTLFIQKTLDPVFGFEDLRNFLEEHKAENYELVEVEGDDHHYGDIEALKRMVTAFLEL
jgi:predicted alpha/beta-hydrolase family hydrolase